MKFAFDDAGGGGLRTIDHLPDGRLLRLQGRNGVGKTVAMRLLALCSGADNPWANERASWKSLVQTLPDGYTIEAHDDGRTISWALFPRRDRWPERLPTEVDPELERIKQTAPSSWRPPVEVRIDGVLQEDGGPLDVKLLSGREGLLEVWTQQVRLDERRFDRLGNHAGTAVGALRDVFGHLQQSWEDADPNRLRAARRHETELRELLEEAQAALEAGEKEARLAQIRQQRRERLTLAEEGVPRLDGEIEDATRQLLEFRSERDELTAQLAAEASGGGLPAREQEELSRALRNEESRRSAHTRAAKQLMSLLEHEELQGIRRSDVGAELREVRREIRSIEKEIKQIRTDEPVLDLARQLRATTDTHAAPDDALLLDSTDLTATVGETRSGLKGRIESLQAAGPLKRLEAALATLQDRRSLLDKVIEAERVLKQKSRLVADVDAARTQQRKQHDVINELASQQEELEGEIENLQERLVDLREQRRVLLGDADDLDELREAVETEGAHRQAAPDENALEEMRQRVARLSAELKEATKYGKRLRDAALAAKHVLDEYGVDRESNNNPLPTVDELISRMQQQLDLGRASFARVREALSTQAPAESSEFREAAQRLAQEYAAVWKQDLSSEAFQNELFDGGQLSAIKVLEGEFSWVDRNERTRRRPIQALSSGQMVYAYTKAMIADLDPPPEGQHRLIVLDEFAAYLDEHTQEQLVGDLREYVQANERTQIVMVLPKDPENEAGWTAEVVE